MEGRSREGLAATILAFDATLRRGGLDPTTAFADDAVLLMPSRAPLVGAAAMGAGLAALAERLARFAAGPPAVLVDGVRAIALIEDAAAAQEPVVEIFSFEGDRIRQLRVLFDTTSQ